MEISQEKIEVSPRFRGQIVQKIYRVWLVRKLLPVLVIEVAILSFVLYKFGKAVFFQRIVNNALNVFLVNPPQIFSFLISAFDKAPFVTKLLGLGTIVLMALILRHLTQGVLRLILVRENYFSRIKKV